MSKLELLEISKKNLFSGEMNLEGFHQDIEEIRNERILQFSKEMPSLMAEFPEQKMLIILIDIVGFSKSTTRQQVYDIYLFQRFLVSQVLSSKFDFSKHINISQFIPTGDGCYIVADECKPEVALKFLIALIKNYEYLQQEEDNPRSLRISAEIGNCVPFIDMAKRKNYIGEGMNEAARILSYGQKALEDKFMNDNPGCSVEQSKIYSRNCLYLSQAFDGVIDEYKENCNSVIPFSNVADKHGKTRNLTVMEKIN